MVGVSPACGVTYRFGYKANAEQAIAPINGQFNVRQPRNENPAAAAVRYAWNIRGPNLPPAGVTVTTVETSYHAGLLNLAPGGSYLWNVKACYAADCSSASAWVATFTFWYLYQPTPTPQNPQGRGQNGGGGIQTTYAITRRNTYFASASSAQAWLVKPWSCAGWWKAGLITCYTCTQTMLRQAQHKSGQQ